MRQLQRNQLMVAYLKTRFDVPELYLSITPMQDNPKFREFLEAENIRTWAVITSDNPFSEVLSDKENEERRFELHKKLKARKYTFHQCFGVGEDPSWKPEEGYFIPNISKIGAETIGKQFGQNAIVWGDNIRGDAEILWLKHQSKDFVERMLLTEVHGCLHRDYCTTGCPQREAKLLKDNKVIATEAKKIINNWKRNGIPGHLIKEENPIIRLHMEDLKYKLHVINILEKKY